MSREFDARDFTTNKATADRRAALETAAKSVSDVLPGAHRVRIKGFDPMTGNPKGLVSEAPPPEKGNYIQRALDHIASVRQALGLAPAQTLEFQADPQVRATSCGAVAVHLQQQYKAIDVFQANQTVRFRPDGLLAETTGTAVTVPDEVPIIRKLSAAEAVLRAANYLAANAEEGRDQFGEPLESPIPDLGNWVPKVIAAFNTRPDIPSLVAAGPFADAIKAALIWFPLAELRLGWHLVIALPGYAGQYRVIVDAQSGEILYCHQMIQSVQAIGTVYEVNGGAGRAKVHFPRVLGDYPVPVPKDLPGSFPGDWVQSNSTAGNCSTAHLEDSGPTLVGQVKDGVLTFDPADAAGDDQRILNIFYYTCFMHDYFYLLGFRESDQNFQQDNAGMGGAAGDPVDARAYTGPVWATASMYTTSDGTSPIMRMGLVTSTQRHTALDASVVFHEYTHGVSHRLVGGGVNDHALEAPQSAGMNEGWSDYIACTVLGTDVVAAWVVNNPTGVRMFAYDSNFPDTFRELGTGRYNEPHNIGEIWCAMLLELNRSIGATLCVQLVVDAWKITPANPSFLDGRDALFAALDAMQSARGLTAAEHDAIASAMWKVCARFGMGPAAQSNGASLQGVTADFSTPASTPTTPAAPASWAPWHRIFQGSQGCVATCSVTSPDRLEVFLVGADGGIYNSFRQGSNPWSGLLRIGAATDRVPAGTVVTAGVSSGRIDLFIVASDGGIYSTYREGSGSWADWYRIGAATDRVPLGTFVSAASPSPDRVELFVVAGDGGIYGTSREGSNAWDDWYRIGASGDQAPLRSVVTAASPGPGRVDLFVADKDGGINSTSRQQPE
jgi:extracellular elastinolytic metalloproteinase